MVTKTRVVTDRQSKKMQKEIKACCFTGYRPNKFDFEYTPQNPKYKDFENKLIDAVFSAAEQGVHDFYCGMAWGFDITAGEAVVMLKKLKAGDNIRLIAVIPFEAQAASWSDEWQMRYAALLKAADRVVYISRDYDKSCYHRRNRYMVDNSDSVITFFDGKSGGTAATLHYAGQKGKEIINIAETNSVETLLYSPYVICDDEEDL